MPENIASINTNAHLKRPRILTIFSILILLVGLYHLIKLSQTILQWDLLVSLPLTVSPIYFAIQGLVWGITGLVLFWSIWTGKTWGRLASQIAVLIYVVAFWIDLIWISEPLVLQTRWAVNLVLTILGLAGVYLIMNSKLSRDFFTRNPATID